MTDEQRGKFLEMIEEQALLDGRFRNLVRIAPNGGSGYFSLVLRAEDMERGGSVVALKFLIPFVQDPYRVRCFEREPEMLKHFIGQRDIIQLIAPHSEFKCTLQPHGFEIPFRYYSVELASSDLAAQVENDGLTLREKLVLLKIMFRAVQCLHNRGASHRDIKPGNFLIMPGGELKLADFGTVRFVDDNSQGILTDYSALPPGDLRYTAPEILACLHDADPSIAKSGDIFSLGACIFEMLTGVPLGVQIFDESFHRDLVAAMSSVSRADRRRTYNQFVSNIADARPLPSVGTLNPGLPRCIIPALDDLYMAAATLDYRRRPQEFGGYFLKIARCILILDNQEKYRRWREYREKVHAASIRKQELRARTVPQDLESKK